MIIYNVTVKIDRDVHDEWLEWQKKEHIPEMISTGCFIHAAILRVLEVEEDEGYTYAIQFHAESKALYNRYIEKFSPGMRKKSFDKWGNKFIAFRTVMEVVN